MCIAFVLTYWLNCPMNLEIDTEGRVLHLLRAFGIENFSQPVTTDSGAMLALSEEPPMAKGPVVTTLSTFS